MCDLAMAMVGPEKELLQTLAERSFRSDWYAE